MTTIYRRISIVLFVIIKVIHSGILIYKVILICLLLLISCKKSSSPSADNLFLIWQETYGSERDEFGISIQQTTDFGFIIVGYSTSNSYQRSIYLVKTDSDGQLVWERNYRGGDSSSGYSVLQSSDGGYIIAGSNVPVGAGNHDVYVVKTDENGDTMWTRSYGSNLHYEGALSIDATNDGGFIISGTTEMMVPVYLGELYVVKIDVNGDTSWTKTYDCGDYGSCIKQTIDGGYIITGGSSTSYQNNGMDIFLLKTNSSGDSLWSRTYGGEESEEGLALCQTIDGDYIIVGTNGDEAILIKTDENGDTIWTKTFDNAAGYSVKQTVDDGYIIAGKTDYCGAGEDDAYVIRTDSDGCCQWTSTYGGNNSDNARSIILSSGYYIVAGSTESFGSGGSDVFLLKIQE